MDIVADAHNIHIMKDGELDPILCTEVLEHLDTPQFAIKGSGRNRNHSRHFVRTRAAK